ncbi:hypothetical protein [Pseudomonas hunanensis]|uniref:hypothetical protein n=1 Tax=Pseudomonas hunanensis TaxID=1247546 RepID=UPI00380FAC15
MRKHMAVPSQKGWVWPGVVRPRSELHQPTFATYLVGPLIEAFPLLSEQVRMEVNALGAVIEIVRRTNLSTLLPAKTALAHDDLLAIPLEPERCSERPYSCGERSLSECSRASVH